MPLILAVGGIEATYTGGRWQGTTPDSDAVLDTLNAMMAEPPGPSGADPYPALTRAQEIARRLRGRIMDEGTAPGFGGADEESAESAHATKAAPRNPDLQSKLAAILARAEADAAAAVQRGEQPDLDALGQRIQAELQAALVQEVLTGVSTTAGSFGVTVDAAARAAEWAARYVPGAVVGMTDTTRQGLQAAIEAYRSTPGMTREQVIAQIAGLFGGDRAEMIADTEAARAQAQGTTIVKDYLEKAGLQYDYIWKTSNDERTCPICGPRNEQVVGADTLPPAHPRCRCRVSLRQK